MAGILKVDQISEANTGQGVRLNHNLKNSSGNDIISTTGELSISGATSTNLVTITQTGSGNALVVEDDGSNPDSTPFVVDNAGHVGVSFSSTQTTPDAFLQVGVGNRTANSYTFRPTVLIGDRPYGDGNASLEFSPNLAVGNGVQIAVDSSKNLKFFTVTSGSYSEKMRIDSSGNVGIGTSSFGHKLGVDGNIQIGTWATSGSRYIGFARNDNNAFGTAGASGLEIESVTGVGNYNQNLHFWTHIYNGGSARRMTINSSGALILAGSIAQKASGTTWTNPSDIRLKENITNYSKGISELNQIQVKQWEYNGKAGTVLGQIGLGVIADEIESVLPNTVDTYSAKLNEDDETETDIKKFDATEITWLLVNTCKEQQALIESQQSQIDTLQNTVTDLLARIEALESN